VSESKLIAALWAYDRTGRYPPQFVGAVAESLRDAFGEESERLRVLAEEWFADFAGEPEGRLRWWYEIVVQELVVPVGPVPWVVAAGPGR
jgi:hypothetical protein